MKDSILYSDLHYKTSITGSLGEPLGKIITVRAAVVPEDEKRSRVESGVPMIKVSSVNGKKLKTSVTIRYETFAWNTPDTLDEGKSYKLIGYETGSMTGIPDQAFDYMLPVATVDFHFDVFFQIVKVEE